MGNANLQIEHQVPGTFSSFMQSHLCIISSTVLPIRYALYYTTFSETMNVTNDLHFNEIAFNLTDWDVTLEHDSSCYSLILSNLASWTDKSSILVHEINTKGLLLTHLKHLLKLQQNEDEIDLAVSILITKTN